MMGTPVSLAVLSPSKLTSASRTMMSPEQDTEHNQFLTVFKQLFLIIKPVACL